MNILFTPPSDLKILDGIKTMTARCWLQPPPRVGQRVYAQTGRIKATRFAILKITGVLEWNGGQMYTIIYRPSLLNPEETAWTSVGGAYKKGIAVREGFEDWNEFYEAYKTLNYARFSEEGRKHWFIEFEMLKDIRQQMRLF